MNIWKHVSFNLENLLSEDSQLRVLPGHNSPGFVTFPVWDADELKIVWFNSRCTEALALSKLSFEGCFSGSRL
jgi:hypothetical protein